MNNNHKWPRVIRDSIHNIVEFRNTDGDRLLWDLINSREFQRLRRIKQLGMSELVFPGANHSRLAHSIGVLVNSKRFLERLRQLGQTIDADQETLILCAALLHDVGHGPYSHAFEKVTKDSHENRTLAIIQSAETEVHQTLVGYNSELPKKLGIFFDEDWIDSESDLVLPKILTEVVTSQMDADRFDYLLRDSLCTGTDYGRFDIDWLLTHLYVDGNGSAPRFFLSQKALLAAEDYVFARYHMYRNVYFHKATRSAEVMLRLIFKRYSELLSKADEGLKGFGLIGLPEASPVLERAFSGSISLNDYLQLDDLTAGEFFKACARCDDKVLKALGRGLADRRLFKAIDVTDYATENAARFGDFIHESKSFIESQGLDPAYFFAADTAADTPYKPYDPDAEHQAPQIYVQTGTGGISEISKISDTVQNLVRKYSLTRYYFPVEFRDEIDRIANRTIKS